MSVTIEIYESSCCEPSSLEKVVEALQRHFKGEGRIRLINVLNTSIPIPREVVSILLNEGDKGLPLVLVEGRIVSKGSIPPLSDLMEMIEVQQAIEDPTDKPLFTETVISCGCQTSDVENCSTSSRMNRATGQKIELAVKESYQNIAMEGVSHVCCPPTTIYSPMELKGIPESALSLSSGCGNPVTSADLKEGEVVLDIGSGGGIDIFLAARRVGEKGRIIGIDASPSMIERAMKNVREAGLNNIELRHGDARALPMEDETVDVVISNCVINTIPDKEKIFTEIFRVLKPGGRMVISDVIADGELPDQIKDNPEAWARCLAGIPEVDYLEAIRKANFEKVEVIERKRRIFREGVEILSLKIRACKPV